MVRPHFQGHGCISNEILKKMSAYEIIPRVIYNHNRKRKNAFCIAKYEIRKKDEKKNIFLFHTMILSRTPLRKIGTYYLTFFFDSMRHLLTS